MSVTCKLSKNVGLMYQTVTVIESETIKENVNSSFSKSYKIGNIGIIANFVFPYICSCLLYLYKMMLVSVKLDVCGYQRITFQSCRLHWTSSFLMAVRTFGNGYGLPPGESHRL